jgi:hypothetical protein
MRRRRDISINAIGTTIPMGRSRIRDTSCSGGSVIPARANRPPDPVTWLPHRQDSPTRFLRCTATAMSCCGR